MDTRSEWSEVKHQYNTAIGLLKQASKVIKTIDNDYGTESIEIRSLLTEALRRMQGDCVMLVNLIADECDEAAS